MPGRARSSVCDSVLYVKREAACGRLSFLFCKFADNCRFACYNSFLQRITALWPDDTIGEQICMDERELRKNQSKLRVLGTGMIALSFWTIVKSGLILWLAPARGEVSDQNGELYADLFAELSSDAPDTVIAIAIVVLMILFFMVLTIGMQLWIGFSARAEGLGKRKGRAYVIGAFLLIAFQAVSVALAAAGVVLGTYSDETIQEGVVSVLFEITCLIIVTEIAFTASRLRRLKRKRG